MKPQTSGAWRRTTLALHSCATRKSRKAACFHLHAFGILCPSEGINELTDLVVMARLMLLSYSRTGSGGKANAKVWQRWAVSMGFPVLPLLLSTLQPRLPRVCCSPLRLSSFPPRLPSPCGSSEKAGGGQGARGEDAHQLYVTSAAAPGIGFSLTSASAGSGLRPAQP